MLTQLKIRSSEAGLQMYLENNQTWEHSKLFVNNEAIDATVYLRHQMEIGTEN